MVKLMLISSSDSDYIIIDYWVLIIINGDGNVCNDRLWYLAKE